jgi:hypothetical protein
LVPSLEFLGWVFFITIFFKLPPRLFRQGAPY